MEINTRFAVVAGPGDLPLDMLRFDRCFPASQYDASIAAYHHCVRAVVVCKDSDTPFNLDRWKSFCWKLLLVTGDQHEATERAAIENVDLGLCS